jgi:hypothetical protein
LMFLLIGFLKVLNINQTAHKVNQQIVSRYTIFARILRKGIRVQDKNEKEALRMLFLRKYSFCNFKTCIVKKTSSPRASREH